jgi:hypothetical protein
MKLAKISQLSGMSLLAVSLAVVPFTKSSQAQVETEPQVAVVETEDDGFDWGLLGLLGLLGLAGLAGKNKSQEHHEVRGTEPFPESTVDRSDTQYR